MNSLYIINVVLIVVNSVTLGWIYNEVEGYTASFLLNLAAVVLNVALVSRVLINA